MQFNDTTNKNGLVQDIDFLCNTNSASYPIEDKTRNINQHYYQIGVLMWRYSPIWKFDDKNFTTHPITEIDLIDDQYDYELPTTILDVDGVFVYDANGNWSPLQKITFEAIKNAYGKDESIFALPSGIPTQYAVHGSSIWLFPKPDTAQCSKIKIHLGRLVDPFTTTDTTKEPGFNPAYHRLLSLGASLDYLMVNNPQRYQIVRNEYNLLLNEFVAWVAKRQAEDRISLKPLKENYE